MKKWVRFDGVKMPARKGKAPESILKHPEQAGADKENQSSAAGPSAPASQITISAPVITASTDKNITTSAVKNTATSDTSGPQYHYSTPVEDPAVILKVVNYALNIPVSINQRELLSISPEAWKQYKELTTMQQVSARTMEVELISWRKSPMTVQQYTVDVQYTTLMAPITSEWATTPSPSVRSSHSSKENSP
jgi:hypothetical protein